MSGARFTWTQKRDQLLREYTRNRFTAAEAARAIGCTPEAVAERRRELRAIDQANSPAVASVPRPVGVQPRHGAKEYPRGVCGTAREAPSGSSWGDPMRAAGSTPTVPAAASSLPVTSRPTLIDISRAPSAMEQRFARAGGR